METKIIAYLLEAAEPIGVTAAVLLYLMMKSKPTVHSGPPKQGFDSDQKLWLRENVVDRIIGHIDKNSS
ncbi:MAG: hypothetical protein AAGG69_00555 [Pseudomonadota bacterium]